MLRLILYQALESTRTGKNGQLAFLITDRRCLISGASMGKKYSVSLVERLNKRV